MHEDEIRALVERDTGDAPASPYGVKARDWMPVAVAACIVLQGETGERLTEDDVDHVVSMVVNGHEDVAYILVTYGTEYGYEPEDFLDDETILMARETAGRYT